ncbi:MAG: tetratricopeptide repeat protein [Phycisphaeraceae bacterium]
MTANTQGIARYLPLLAAGLLVLIVGISAVVLIQNRTGDADAPLDAQTQEELTKAREAVDFYINSDRLPEARLILERLLQRYPDEAQAHALMAKLLMAEDAFAEAYRHADRSVQIDPGDHEVQFLTALLAEQNREFEKARDHYIRATELAPQVAGYAMYLAQAHIRLDEIDEASVHLERAQRLDATLSQIYSMQAEIAARQDDIEAAIALVDQALEQTDREERHYVNYTLQKAELLRRDGNADGAQAVLLALPPGKQQEQRVVQQLSEGYYMLDQPERAAAVWSELFALEPGNARAAAETGLAFYRAQQYEHAKRYHEYARRISTNHQTVLALEEALQDAN